MQTSRTETLMIPLRDDFLRDALLYRKGKYILNGKNWTAIIYMKKYGWDRMFLTGIYGKIDFRPVKLGDLIEIASDYRYGGRYPNHFRSQEYSKTRAYYVVTIREGNYIELEGGFPDIRYAFDYAKMEKIKRKEAQYRVFPD